jgi:hypothetical protein
MPLKRTCVKAIILIAGSLLVSGTASAASFLLQCSVIAGGINRVNDQTETSCALQDKLFQFIGSSSDAVFIGSLLNSPAGMNFYGATQTNPDGTGNTNAPTSENPIDIEYIVTVINPFNDSPNPQVISASTIASLVNGAASGFLGGTAMFCVGQLWDASGNSGFNGNFTGDDGCAANGGTLTSTALSSGNAISFGPTVTSVAVWDHITLNAGADFGDLGQTFTEVSPAPEPISLGLLGCGMIAMGLIRRRRSSQLRTGN